MRSDTLHRELASEVGQKNAGQEVYHEAKHLHSLVYSFTVLDLLVFEEFGDLASNDPVLQGEEPVHRIISKVEEERSYANQDCERDCMVVMQACLFIVEADTEKGHSHVCHNQKTDQGDQELETILAAYTVQSDCESD